MKDTIEKIVGFENEVIENLERRYPKVTKFYVGMYNGKRYGIQLFDDSGRREDYTVKFDNNRMSGYEDGIRDVSITSRCRASYIEDILREYRPKFARSPILTMPGYLWTSLKAVLRGDVRIGKR